MFLHDDAPRRQATDVQAAPPGTPPDGPVPGPASGPAPRELRLDTRETVETTTSVVFLTEDRAYKLRKPVDLGFLDLRSRGVRLRACEDEVRLNRPLAPDAYLGVADIRDESGVLCDHMVVMRRMPAARRLSTLVAALPAGADAVLGELRILARRLAAFHEECETSTEIARDGGLSAQQALWLAAMDGIAPFRGRLIDAAVADEIGRLALRYLAGRGPLLARRQRAGRIRGGHGDLRAGDIYCLPDGPRVLGSVSSDPALRRGDVLGDVASLAADLEHLGAPAAAHAVLAAYREAAGETGPASLEHLHLAYRAVVRAGEACVRSHQGDPAAAADARGLAALALRHLRRGRVRLVLVGGLPGTGKSTLARELAGPGPGEGWLLLRSDVVRKELAGLPPEASAVAEPGEGIYAADATEHSYAELLTRARHALEHGQSVVIDASWSSARARALAAAAARECDAELVQLRCVSPPRVAVARIVARTAASAAGRAGATDTGPVDPSDATERVYFDMATRTDPWPEARDVDTATSADTALALARPLVD
ncbi:bifunctional aminoglycoside phosphotransferase/ATP-binding protein [Parafrankia elaeagni]|uniref:bifunctional aminoglycoside phosphotransferase/ATP-binding protein n=1 Tax=Parafrankia elaeagni TaxID=222534 RepID=UPI0005526025|nr:AAA family ATPase [Parafrankia elaeagni]